MKVWPPFAIVFLVCWVAACVLTGCNTPNPPPPRVLPDGERATCGGMCAHLRALGCEEAEPTPEGDTCEAICANALAVPAARLDIACIQTAPTCDAAGEC